MRVDDAGRRRVERAHYRRSSQSGFARPRLVGGKQHRVVDVVECGPLLEFPQDGPLLRSRGHHELATAPVGNAPVATVVVQPVPAPHAPRGLAAGWGIVDSRMNHFAVAARGFAPDAAGAFEQENFRSAAGC